MSLIIKKLTYPKKTLPTKITTKNDEAFFAGLKQMLTDASLRGFYAAKAKERGSAFSAEKLTEMTENYFMQLAGE